MADLHPDDRAALAQRLGMKTTEIIGATEVSADPPAVLVQTHDGQHVLVTEDAVQPWTGTLTLNAAPRPAAAGAPDDVPPPSGDDLDPDAVPAGTAEDVLTWVGDDKDRATRALQAEQARDKPRSGLTAQLEKLAGLA